VPLVTCPSCRTELDVPADWLGDSIRCSDCQAEFVARAPARARPSARPRDDEDDRPRRRAVYDDDDDEDDRPRRRRRRPQKGGGAGKVLLILGGVGLLILLVCGGGIGWFVVSIGKPMTFAESDWRDHPVPDGAASVQVPVAMKPDPIPSPGFGVTVHKDMWEASGLKDAAFAFGVVDCPAGNPITLEEVYRDERDEVVDIVDGRIVSERNLTVQGCPAKEFEFASGNAHGVYRIVFLQERTRKRFFLIMAGGRNMTAADRSKFIESFRIKTRK
jgi:LSD1 subclass zinc finger protein